MAADEQSRRRRIEAGPPRRPDTRVAGDMRSVRPVVDHYHVHLYEVDDYGAEFISQRGDLHYVHRDAAERVEDMKNREMPLDALARYEYRTYPCGDRHGSADREESR